MTCSFSLISNQPTYISSSQIQQIAPPEGPPKQYYSETDAVESLKMKELRNSELTLAFKSF